MERLINFIYKLRFFSWLIAFFIGGVFYTLTCNAQALPTISNNTFSVISGGNSNLIDVGFLPRNLALNNSITSDTWSPWNVGAIALTAVDNNDIEISTLTEQEQNLLLNSFLIVDSNGDLYDGEIYHLTYDNGYFTGECYVDENGELLAYSNDLGGKLLKSKFGGSLKDSEDWQNMFKSESTKVYESNLTVYNNPDLVQDVSFYAFRGLRWGNNNFAYDLFIPNQYQPGVIIPATTSNNSIIYSWYYNNANAFQLNVRFGEAPSGTFIYDTGTYNHLGVSYTHKLTIYSLNNSENPNTTYTEWLNNGLRESYGTFAHSGYLFKNNINTSDKPLTFKPLQLPEGSEIINYNYYYSYNDIQELEQQLNDLQSQLNNSYNPNSNISSDNYPIYYPTNIPDLSPSKIPSPNQNPNPNPFPESNPNVNPSIENPYPDINPSDLNNSIPIISGLQNKFPFSIPWDIYNLVKGLSVPREIPVLEFEITFPIINYTWQPVIDLTMYDSTATLFRTLFLIIFIIGLAVFSYNHFFGS